MTQVFCNLLLKYHHYLKSLSVIHSILLGSRLHLQGNLAQVRAHLLPLLASAKEKLVEYGTHDVPIYLLATQGMRNLPEEGRMLILNFAHTVMNEERHNGDDEIFRVGNIPDALDQPDRSARVIGGDVEGLLAWVAVNHGFVNPKDPTAGIFEIGGASMQIAFDNGNAGGDNVKQVCLSTGVHNVYTVSWSNYGVDSVWERVAAAIPEVEAGPRLHPCVRLNQRVTVNGIDYTGSPKVGVKWHE